MKTRIVIFAVALLLTVPAFSPAREEEAKPDFDTIFNAVSPSLVRVEYTFRHDKGEEPQAIGRYSNASGYITEERPMEKPGFLLTETEVVTTDLQMHPRFIEKVEVRRGDEVVPARIAGFATRHNAQFITLEKPLPDTRPLTFDPALEEPYFAVNNGELNGEWVFQVKPFALVRNRAKSGRKTINTGEETLLVTKDGNPVTLTMNSTLPDDDGWKSLPTEWERVSIEDWTAQLKAIEEKSGVLLPRITLNFRSPRKEAANPFAGRNGNEETVRHMAGIMLDRETLLVPVSLDARVTARLESIQVHSTEGDPAEATFAHSLKDYNALIAKMKTPIDIDPAFFTKDLFSLQNRLITVVDLRIQGESRISYFTRFRIPSFDIGWKRRIYPSIPGNESRTFFFDQEGSLVAFPVERRADASMERSWNGGQNSTPSAHITDLLADLEKHVDPTIVPLSEEEEMRLAWLGVVLQPLDQELARMNEVSDQTRDGEIGAIVNYVYPGSPAAEAGVEMGMILLRLHAEDQPKPIEISVGDTAFYFKMKFPWDQFDQFPVMAFENAPTPWVPAENSFTRTLTDIGFGKGFEAEFFHNGEIVKKSFKVTQSPDHHGQAKRFKSEAIGLTVREITFEVRRYFQMTDDDPGLIISKVEQGSKADVGGIKPFEIITAVNDEPVASVKEFETAVSAGGELRFSIKRLTVGRIVKITAGDKAEEEPENGDAKEPEENEEPVESPDSEK